ncbi:ADP-ribosylglycohydrolase [seawater metagenome]|uniref:ADP-ribosylglycohydrolase n=1 Tax=seawater metagenome TaxID=1561972 RepID=A0A5E8CLR9_9ZZZZ
MSLDKFKACLLLASFGDTLGFNNGMWEFNYGLDNPGPEITMTILWEFVSLGGINHINLKRWDASDDTILQIATAKALINNFSNMKQLKQNFIEEYVNVLEELKKNKRAAGINTIKTIEILKKEKNSDKIIYDIKAGGNGSSMRTMAIGLAFNGKKNREKLIEAAINCSIITHNNSLAYLGSIVTALFVAYGMEGIHPLKWCDKLVKLFDSELIDKIIDKNFPQLNPEYKKNKDNFIDKWRFYLEDFQTRDRGEFFNPLARIEYYAKNFSPQINVKGKKDYSKIGASGLDSVIIAYDSLLFSLIIGNNEERKLERIATKFEKIKDLNNTFLSWETLVIYSMLHVGDNDTTGTIAASWYGAYQGFKGVPKNNIQNLEFEHQIKNVSQNLYEKFK